MVNSPADGAGPGGQLHAQELVNIIRSINGYGVLNYTYSMTVTGGNMVVTIPAFDAVVPDGSGGQVTINKSSATNVTISASDPTDPRVDIIYVDSAGNVAATAGTPTAETGSVLEAPMPALAADEIMLAKVKVGNGVSVIGTDKVFGRAIDVRNAAVSLYQPAQILAAEMFVEQGGAILETSGAWTTANSAIYIPFRVNRSITVKKLNHYNGSTIGTDNFDIGVYDSDGDGLPQTRLVSLGSTALSGADAWQAGDVTDTVLAAGLYYLAVAFNGATDHTTRLAAVTIAQSRAFSMYEQLTAFPLPATASPAVFTATRNVPLAAVNRATT